MSAHLSRRFLDMDGDPVMVAKALLGQTLVRVVNGKRMAGRIVEVEAYLGAKDRGAHTYRGHRSARNEAMYMAGGHAYVYFIYGVHHCLNVVCGKADDGVAVLVRGLEPTEGIDLMRKNRGSRVRLENLCDGPGKLTQALDINLSLNGTDLRTSEGLFIERTRTGRLSAKQIQRSPRVALNTRGTWGDADVKKWEQGLLRFCLRPQSRVTKP